MKHITLFAAAWMAASIAVANEPVVVGFSAGETELSEEAESLLITQLNDKRQQRLDTLQITLDEAEGGDDISNDRFAYLAGLALAAGYEATSVSGYYEESPMPSFASLAFTSSGKPLAFSVQPGRLKSNLEEMLRDNGYPHIVWHGDTACVDWNVVAGYEARAETVSELLRKIITGYPLRASLHGHDRVAAFYSTQAFSVSCDETHATR
ncbi:hypothetical protein RM531_09100 [Salinisphaera sp. P385]|uniref:Uncharacterized protein n=1 Tax=Spectribacter acetivorans TaxID=3075603 RepID=A0ABU3B842_9GAMM|nr:hypothetical protein [Salinisphaera sp. P385]MDT0618636.1 hypothetical protein [Salinisphaera sp. P385]